MKARCGLEDCDCEYTIEKLVAALEEIARRHTEARTWSCADIAREAIGKAKEGQP